MTEKLIKLIEEIEPNVVGVLYAKGLIEIRDGRKGYKFDNISITLKGKNVIGDTKFITDKYVENYRKLFPAKYRGSTKTIRKKLERFIDEHDCSLDDIYKAAQLWLEDNETPYHGKAVYFLYKQQKGGEISRCEEYLELLNNREVEEIEDIELL